VGGGCGCRLRLITWGQVGVRMRRMLAVAVTAGLGAFGLALGSGPVGAGGSGVVVTPFDYTGALQQFRVPDGICSVTVEAWGASGGFARSAGDSARSASQPSAASSFGGYAKATLGVQPQSTLWVSVGGVGGDAVAQATLDPLFASATPGVGGWPDGGLGGAGSTTGLSPVAAVAAGGGGGGGSSDVRQGGSDRAHRVVVAGGGGGFDRLISILVGTNLGLNQQGLGPGGGGGLEGDPGDNPFSISGVTAAGGGTQSQGGAGGVPGGWPGTDAVGGRGGDASQTFTGDGYEALGVAAAGGGGGGFYGGGGGPALVQLSLAEQTSQIVTVAVGGGGGGSGHGPDGTTFQTAVRNGNGHVTITYDPATDACTGHLLVNKKVKGDPPDDADYTIRYSCVTDDQSPVVKQVVVHGAGTAVDEYFGGAPVTCTVTEPGSDDADKVKFSCSPSDGAVCEADNRVTFPSGALSEATITVTNIFEEEEEPAPTPTAAVPVAVAVAPTFTG
jgi:hypothetical protein